MRKTASSDALCEVIDAPVRHPNRRQRQHLPVPAWRFREARLSVGLSVVGCAELLKVSERTMRGWESGATRIPYTAYKLLRLLRGGRVLSHPDWKHFTVRGNVLISPEGHEFVAGELGWLSLLVRRARAFAKRQVDRTDLAETGSRHAARAAASGPASRPDGQQEEEQAACSMCGASNTAHLYQIGTSESPGSEGSSLGLVYSSTSGTRNPENPCFPASQLVAAEAPDPASQPALRADRDPAGDRLDAALWAAGGAR